MEKTKKTTVAVEKNSISPATTTVANVNTSTFNEDLFQKIVAERIEVTKRLSSENITYIRNILHRVMPGIKKSNTWSISLFESDKDKKYLKEQIFDKWMHYTKPSFKVKWVDATGYNESYYNLKKFIEANEDTMETELRTLNIIGPDNKILNLEKYKEYMSKCRLLLDLSNIAKEFTNGNMKKIDKDGKELWPKKNTYIFDNLTTENFTPGTHHEKMYTEKIVPQYEAVLNVKFENNPYAVAV